LIGGALFEEGGDEGVAFVLDLTERKKVEGQLRRDEAWLTQAQSLSRTGNWVYDATAMRYVYWSDESYRIWGFDPQGGLPSRENMWQRIHPDDRDRVWRVVQEAVGQKEDFTAEFRILLPDKTIKHLVGTSHHLFSPLGTLVEVMTTTVDVTERKRAEEALCELESEFAHLNRVSMMGELAASLAHEITQPIASARNNARAAQNFLRRRPREAGEVGKALACIVGDADRAGHIVHRIREHIKKAPPQKERLDLNAAINEVIVLARSAIIRNGASVQMRLADGLFPV